jgi:hypothetical protein
LLIAWISSRRALLAWAYSSFLFGPLADHLDRRAAQAVGTLRGLDQPILAAAGLLQRLPTCRGQGLLLGLVPGVQLDGVHAQADRVFLVLPLRFGSCLPFGRSLERAKPRLQLRLGKVAG